MRWTRIAIATRVDSLTSQYSGKELVNAIVAFSETLEDDDRETLRRVLLGRADEVGVYAQALERRHESARWNLFRHRSPRDQ
jgi:hypothetical protein